MQGTSTARLMAIWAIAMAPFSVVTLLLSHALARMLRFNALGAVLQIAATFLLAVAAGWIQMRLLARHRRPVPAWGLAVALGSVAGAVLGNMAQVQVRALAQSALNGSPLLVGWLFSVLWSSTYALSLGVAQALAVWGRRWGPDVLLWIAGILALRVLPMTALRLVPEGPADGLLVRGLVFSLAHGAVISAGTVWLLDRLAFRRAPEA